MVDVSTSPNCVQDRGAELSRNLEVRDRTYRILFLVGTLALNDRPTRSARRSFAGDQHMIVAKLDQ